MTKRTTTSRATTGWVTLALIAVLAAATPAWPESPGRSEVVKTTLGPVQGLVVNGVNAFLGLRYGAPPVRELRFKPPQEPAAWTEIAEATAFGAPAIQMVTGPAASPTTELARQLATVFTVPTEMELAKEDCLFLNVWTRGLGDGRKRPVMVWLHGGGYAYGSGSWPIYDGHNLADRGDVVVVTINHRLNVFGYLYLGELAGESYAASGNAGMLDLVAALEWVRDNIEAFGGDPSNVTIFGESGGGAKVSTLMAMPRARGLFHKAIVQSGPGLRGVERSSATEFAKIVLAELEIGADSIEALFEVPSDEMLAAAFAAMAKVGAGPGGPRQLAPVVDGVILPTHPFDPAAPSMSADIPVLIGWNKDEMTLFTASQAWFGSLTEEALAAQAKGIVGEKAEALLEALREAHPDYSPTYLLNGVMTADFMFVGSVNLAERKAAQNGAPVYMYNLVWETPVGAGVFKSPHTLEIPFVFKNVDKAFPLVGTGYEGRLLEERMSDAWLAFARTGDPNTADLPDWPAYDEERRATMVFDVESRVVEDPLSDVRKILQD